MEDFAAIPVCETPVERQVERAALSGEVLVELTGDVVELRRVAQDAGADAASEVVGVRRAPNASTRRCLPNRSARTGDCPAHDGKHLVSPSRDICGLAARQTRACPVADIASRCYAVWR